MKLKALLKKSNDFLPSDVSIQEVIDTMITNRIKHIVLLENNKPVGILTERDILFLYTNHTNFDKPAIEYSTKDLIVTKENRKIDYALNLMIDNYIRRVIIVDKEKNYIGSINQEDLIFEFEQDAYKSDIKVKELIKPNNKAMYIKDDQSLQEAIDLMTSNNIGSILVYNKKSSPIGIITESDIVSFAHKHIDTNEKVSLYMHFPIISFDENESLLNVVKVMKEKKIRRVLIDCKQNNEFYVVTSKDILNNIKGNYSIYLESKLRDAKKTFNLLDETVIEIFDFENEQIIHWFNKKAKKLFDINIDDDITEIIPKDVWDDLYKQIKNKKYKDDKILKIKNKSYKIAAIHTTILENSVIKILFDDVTNLIEKQNNNLDIYKASLDLLPNAIAIVDEEFNIIYKNTLFNLKPDEIKEKLNSENSSSLFHQKLSDHLYLITIINT